MIAGAALATFLSVAAPARIIAEVPSEWAVRYVQSSEAGRERTEFDVGSDGRYVQRIAAFDRRRHAYVASCPPRTGVLWHWFALAWAVDQSFREDWHAYYRNAATRDGATVIVRVEDGAHHVAKTASLDSPYALGAEGRPDGLNYIVTTLRRASAPRCGRMQA